MKTLLAMFRFLALLLALASPALAAEAQSPTKTSRIPGRVIVAKVTGTVRTTGPDGKTRELKAKDEIGENHTLVSEAGSSAVLVFSNGSTVFVRPETTFEIERFLQDPFDEAYNVTTATEEPTTSVTSLKIRQGSLVCNVKKLRANGENPSSFTVDTPVGAAGIRGTIIDIEYLPGADDTAQFTLSVTEGSVQFTPAQGGGPPTLVEAGRQISINARVQGGPTGGQGGTNADPQVIEQSPPNDRPIPQEKIQVVNQLVTQMNESTANVVIPPPPPPTNDGPGDRPSPPVVPELPLNPNTTTDANPPTQAPSGNQPPR